MSEGPGSRRGFFLCLLAFGTALAPVRLTFYAWEHVLPVAGRRAARLWMAGPPGTEEWLAGCLAGEVLAAAGFVAVCAALAVHLHRRRALKRPTNLRYLVLLVFLVKLIGFASDLRSPTVLMRLPLDLRAELWRLGAAAVIAAIALAGIWQTRPGGAPADQETVAMAESASDEA